MHRGDSFTAGKVSSAGRCERRLERDWAGQVGKVRLQRTVNLAVRV